MAEAITRAALVDAALDLNKVLRLTDDETDPAGSMGIDVKQGVGKLRRQIVEAGTLVDAEKDLDQFALGTVLVLDGLRAEILAAVPRMREDEIREQGPEAIEGQAIATLDAIAARASEMRGTTLAEGEVEAGEGAVEQVKAKAKTDKKESRKGGANLVAKEEAKERKEVSERKVFVARFRKVRRGSNFAKVLDIALATPPGSALAVVAANAGLSAEKALAALKAARRTNGIDHQVADDGTLTIILPEGVDAEGVWKESKERAPVTKTNGSAERKRRYADDGVIKLLVDKNPKKPGASSYDRFELYRDGMTCAQFLASGGQRGDLSWDTNHGFIEIG